MALTSLVPATHEEDLTAAMATLLRTAGMTFDGDIETVEDRAFNILWRPPAGSGAYSYADIKPRLSAAIAMARELGPIDLQAETAGAGTVIASLRLAWPSPSSSASSRATTCRRSPSVASQDW